MSKETVNRINQGLENFLENARKKFQMDLVDPILFASIKEFILRDGKRIRPALLIYSYQGYKKHSRRLTPSIYYVSTCIELLHNFMLIHDDIIDHSDLRRGKPTMHRLLEKATPTPQKEKLGQDLSIVAGDIVYAMAIDAFLSIKENPARKEAALHYFLKTAVFTAMGEFIDTLNGARKISKISEQNVLLNYSLKTARYTFECPLVVGAILAGADKKEIKFLSEFGLLMGQAFQIQDDIIGIFNTQKIIGKSILSDLTEGKKTILVTHAFQTLKGANRKQFLEIFGKPVKTHQDLVKTRKLFLSCGSLKYSLGEVEKRLKRAKRISKKLRIKSFYGRQIEHSLLHFFKHSYSLAKDFRIPFFNVET